MFKKIITCVALLLYWPALVFACDPCSLYSVRKLQEHSEGAISVAISEQFTKLKRVQTDNISSDEYTKGFSTTQFSTNYDATDNLGFQLNIPYVIRSYAKTDRSQDSTEYDTGIGDISLGANFSPYVYRKNSRSVIFSLIGAVKLPTGDTGSLSAADNTATRLAHHPAPINRTSGGRTLTIGTGSVDYVLGTSLSARLDKLIWLSYFQYALRTEGDFDYRFGNDIVWNTGPGWYLILKDEQTLAFRAILSGEHKGKDTLNGNKVAGSSISNLYLGPEIIMTLKTKWVADLGLDLPTYVDDSDTTLKPSWRVRTSLSYRF